MIGKKDEEELVDFTLKSIGYILVGSKEEMSKETMRLAEDFIERTMGLTVYEFVLLVKGELRSGGGEEEQWR